MDPSKKRLMKGKLAVDRKASGGCWLWAIFGLRTTILEAKSPITIAL